MGVRNSFGLAIDPVTGNLWATENGDDDFDEINLIPDKLNSGWNKIMGPATESELASLPGYEDYVYDDPEFSWEKVVSPVGLDFGKFKETNNYDNSLFVGDCNNGHLYKFELNKNRDGFEFANPDLQDNVVNKNESMEEIIVGTGFRCITDIERGPDGFLYLISHGEKNIYRILPVEALDLGDTTATEPSLEENILDKGIETTKDIVEKGTEIGQSVIEKGTEIGQSVIEKGEEIEQQQIEKRVDVKETLEQKSTEIAQEIEETVGGGCLIATATYGSELAPQVQQLRELRDNKLLQTKLGSAFMQGFNDFYYSFSPVIADYERENLVFKEAVKLVITPMISSLSILNYVDMNSEAEILGYGISLMILNIGMYLVAPAMIIGEIRKRL
jgi:hypothetical protein